MDIGCGSGVHSNLLKTYGCIVTAIDNSEHALKHAKQLYGENNIFYQKLDLKDFNTFKPDYKYEVVVDRLSSVHTTKNTINNIYYDPKSWLSSGAKIYWECFSKTNTHARFAQTKSNDFYSSFVAGKFKSLGQACFFEKSEILELFKKYQISKLTHVECYNAFNDENDSRWILEACFNG